MRHKPKMGRIFVRFTYKEHRDLRAASKSEGLTMSDYIRALISLNFLSDGVYKVGEGSKGAITKKSWDKAVIWYNAGRRITGESLMESAKK